MISPAMRFWYWMWDDWSWVSNWWGGPTIVLGAVFGFAIAELRAERRYRGRRNDLKD